MGNQISITIDSCCVLFLMAICGVLIVGFIYNNYYEVDINIMTIKLLVISRYFFFVDVVNFNLIESYLKQM